VLYLDDPTIGLDILSKTKVWEFLRKLNDERGTTVLLTTHDLTDIEQLCSRVMVIDHGTLVYNGRLDRLHRLRDSERTLVVDLATPLPPIEVGQCARHPGRRSAAVAELSHLGERSAARFRDRHPLSPRRSVHPEPEIETVIARMYAQGATTGDSNSNPHDAGGVDRAT
jgi:ABC-2 type transport system ATP-binding protein